MKLETKNDDTGFCFFIFKISMKNEESTLNVNLKKIKKGIKAINKIKTNGTLDPPFCVLNQSKAFSLHYKMISSTCPLIIFTKQ